MKKTLITILIVLPALAGTAWFNQIDLMLAMVQFQTSRDYEVEENKPIPWHQGPAQAVVSPQDRPPNVIVILADDLGINDISSFGGGVADGQLKTPNIDELAASGANFAQAYSGAGTCAPSRAMLLTGRYPTRTGFEFTPTPGGMGPMVKMISSSLDNGLPPSRYNERAAEKMPSYDEQALPASEITLAEILRDRGYYTAHIGKWHLGKGEGVSPEGQGFAQSLYMHSGLYLPKDHPDVVNAELPFDPIDKFLWAKMRYATTFTGDSSIFEPKGYLTDYWTEESLKVIKVNKNRPFFLYLAHWGAHTPLQATREDYEAVGDIKPHRARVYAAMIRAVDRSVGRILETLEAEGLSDNTIVVFSSDNGGAGYIGMPDVNTPYRGWKLTMFEGGIRVPLFMRWPAKIARETNVDTPVAHIDFLPTLAAAANAPLPKGRVIDGENLLPLATGKANGEWARDTLFWQSGYYQVVRHKDWKLQVSDNPKKQWLFDLSVDPTEQVNLADKRPDVVAKLNVMLEQHQAGRTPALYPYVAEMPVAIDKSLAEKVLPGDETIYWPN
ncbi:MAG: arylsulfatase A-like enzyme [Zhongshania sp.]|jgi:arylsulfatase A-like enzyme